jgi:hypothetical protein
MRLITIIIFLLAATFLFSQSPLQVVRGTVNDADSRAALEGAHLMLIRTDTLRTFSDAQGQFIFSSVPVGRYRLQASFLGYETVMVAEVLVEAGKEAVQDIQLRERSQALGEVVVKAQAGGQAEVHPISVYTITVEEQFRFPATFFDPARVALSYPGVTGMNDGTNIISVRGNAPGAVKWRLEGVEIVNPNHTANAGTFSDRPAQAGGGVNILSAQLLGTSHFLTGAFPAGYGNALGGILDMRLRRGNDRQHEFTAQAGLIGIDLAAEGPIAGGASYLANYRYSFTGLLSALGLDFGGEAIAFQDLSVHLSLPTEKAGQFSLFGMGGKNSTIFRAPESQEEVLEDKQRFDIDFLSQMGAAGLTHVIPMGKNSVLRSVAVVSALEHDRTADLVWMVPEKQDWDGDFYRESKLALSSIFSSKINARHRLRAGIQASREYASLEYFGRVRYNFVNSGEGNFRGWLLQPFADWQATLAKGLDMTAGLQVSHLSSFSGETRPEPRLALSYSPGKRTRLSVSYALLSQIAMPQVYFASSPQGPGLTRSHHFGAAYRLELRPSLVFQAEVYYQHLLNVPVDTLPGSAFSTLNATEAFRVWEYQFTGTGRGRNYGLDLSLQQFILDKYYFIAAASLYRSLYTAADGLERPTRFDGRYLLNLTGGREFTKHKAKKVVVRGVNAHLLWMGGYRGAPVDLARSVEMGYTVYDESNGYPLRQEDYFRIDLRFYQKWNRAGRNSTLSVDLQNVTGRENFAFEYYDFVQQNVQVKRQLGLIPIASWRLEF